MMYRDDYNELRVLPMNTTYAEQAMSGYQQAEEKAARYFAELGGQIQERSFIPALTADFQEWKRAHLPPPWWLTLLSRSKSKPDSRDERLYIQWLNRTGRLNNYLDRSVSYFYLRDMGKTLDSDDTRSRVARMVSDLSQRLIRYAESGSDRKTLSGMDIWYRRAQKEGVEDAVIWLIGKLHAVSNQLPDGMDAEQAQRKLIKIILGVVLHVVDDMEPELPRSERAERLDAAIRIGYSYGLTYPFIDDLLDSPVLSETDKNQFTRMIRTALLTGTVPGLGEWKGKHTELIAYVHAELREAFETIRNRQRPELRQLFFEQAYVFFQAQEIDRNKDLSNGTYTNEELYLPVILKSASSRSIVRSVLSAPPDEGFEQRTFYYGIYNQLADDYADLFTDLEEGAVTPYTYYWKYRNERTDLLNPFEVYWTVISHLIHQVYRSDPSTREVILDRAINGLKRSRERLGDAKYNELMSVLTAGMPDFNRMIQQLVYKAEDVDFFDKLLRDRMLTDLRTDREEQEHFRATIDRVRVEINNLLPLSAEENLPSIQAPLIDAANFALQGDGKRIRPIMTWVMAVEQYHLDPASIAPLLRSLEYMHTASLIFDDLPSQDNAASRRGRPTLHQLHDEATAELTGLFLIQRAVGEQAALDRYDPAAVLKLIRYSARKTEEMCVGQAMDLEGKGKPLTLEQLNELCFYKTGIAFEASLVMPAILAGAEQGEIEALKRYAYHAGIAFQIRDDLLDVEGDRALLGKPVGQDAENNRSTFVSVLGMKAARREMWEHYCLATEALAGLPRRIPFLKHLLQYLVHRNR